MQSNKVKIFKFLNFLFFYFVFFLFFCLIGVKIALGTDYVGWEDISINAREIRCLNDCGLLKMDSIKGFKIFYIFYLFYLLFI
jgi:hypothetical protein